MRGKCFNIFTLTVTSQHLARSHLSRKLCRQRRSVTFYKDSVISPHPGSLNKLSVYMNNEPFKRPTIGDVSSLSDQQRLSLATASRTTALDHPLCALIGATQVSAMLNLIDWFRGGAPIKGEPDGLMFCTPTQSGCTAAAAETTVTPHNCVMEKEKTVDDLWSALRPTQSKNTAKYWQT